MVFGAKSTTHSAGRVLKNGSVFAMNNHVLVTEEVIALEYWNRSLRSYTLTSSRSSDLHLQRSWEES